jgi:hypothetical protein
MYALGFSEKKFNLSENPDEVRPFDGTKLQVMFMCLCCNALFKKNLPLASTWPQSAGGISCRS